MSQNENDHMDSYNSCLLENYIRWRLGILNEHISEMLFEMDPSWYSLIESQITTIFIAMIYNCEFPMAMRSKNSVPDELTVTLIHRKIRDYIETIDDSIVSN